MGIDNVWMQRAYEQALIALAHDEVPVGAVLVSKENVLLAEGYNRVMMDDDPTAHAEMLVIREACARLNNYRLIDATLYVTLEPCVMCAGALVAARVKRLVFGTRDLDKGAAGSACNFLQHSQLNHHVLMDEGILQEASSCLLRDFFQKRR